MPAAFLQLQRNAEFWPTRSFPKAPQPERKPCTGAAGLGGGRVTFEGDPVVFQWYPGQGLQIQPLANFGKANALWRACQPPEQPPQPGAAPPPPCRPEELRALLDRMVALASQRGGFTAWEYFFAFGGGTPPWISGLAQGTAIQALTRGSQLLADPRYVEFARGALGAFETQAAARRPRAPRRAGAAATTSSTRSPPACACSTGSCSRSSASTTSPTRRRTAARERLFKAGDRAARREIPRYDTGAWSLYASGGAESDLGYHRLVRDFLQSLCDRTKRRAYCGRAKTFDRYLHERTRVGFGGVGAVRLGADASVRFTLSKLSCVTLRVRRGEKLVHVRKLVMPRGLRGLTYHPTRAGRYTVEVQAVDLLNHYTRVEHSLPVKPRKGRRAPRA